MSSSNLEQCRDEAQRTSALFMEENGDTILSVLEKINIELFERPPGLVNDKRNAGFWSIDLEQGFKLWAMYNTQRFGPEKPGLKLEIRGIEDSKEEPATIWCLVGNLDTAARGLIEYHQDFQEN